MDILNMVLPKDAALILIDIQLISAAPGFEALNNPNVDSNIQSLLHTWREKKLPIFHVMYHSPRKASPYYHENPLSQLKNFAKPIETEPLIVKHFESAFFQTDLEDRLRKNGYLSLFFVGFFTDQCIASTVKVANNLEFNVFVVSDATATTGCTGYNGKFYEAEDIHQLTLGCLQRDSITIIETSTLLELF
jgi:nicotinamidase-related amidase